MNSKHEGLVYGPRAVHNMFHVGQELGEKICPASLFDKKKPGKDNEEGSVSYDLTYPLAAIQAVDGLMMMKMIMMGCIALQVY